MSNYPQGSQDPAVDYSNTFEGKVLTGLSSLTARLSGVEDEIKRHREALHENTKTITDIQLSIAARTGNCPLVESLARDVNRNFREVNKKVSALQRMYYMTRGGYKAMAAIAAAVCVVLAAAYHALNVPKLLATLTGTAGK